ncbi:hypothetical protein GPECTOR_50g611 [Gonium pectorale]|uniref:Galactose oxidase-like Early set domain-containing protein n=1 Tax=Gonium pectorale TaxID=33097 RepID=A0A150G7J6_GONPE|nr:hypothetical protein GPECTOR_50g611 [Gonium pectorale]|eukprot:KXZ45817.1 hypothetical protein GPECTOR_50g611 [Gonium pectorale]
MYMQVGLSYAVAVHLTHIPGTTRYLFMERPSGKHPDKKTFIAGYYDIATNKYTNVFNTDSLFCNGAVQMANGNIAVIGGHIAKSGYADGLKSLRIYDKDANTLVTVANMKFPRWYPSANLLPDGRILMMGGTQAPGSGTKNNPICEIWDPENNPLKPPVQWTLPGAFVSKAGDIYYSNNYMLPSGDMFVYCDSAGLILNPYNGTVITDVPPHTNLIKTIRLEYPFSACSVMLPLTPANGYTPEFVFFGGQFGYGWTNTLAVDLALRVKVSYDAPSRKYSFSNWTMEKMNNRRVMGDAVLLPNGCVILLNGAQQGVAGDSATGGTSKASLPQFWAVLYDPAAPDGTRFTRLARSQIARMYHSTAALTPDGTIVVAGCDRCDYFNSSVPFSKSPWGLPEYRVEIFYPPFYFWDMRPALLPNGVPPIVTYGQRFSVLYDTLHTLVDIDGVVLMAPSSTTHSTNFNQRAVGLRILGDDYTGTLTVEAPPNLNIAPPGYYMLFLLSGQAYSSAQWIQVKSA